MSAPAFRSAVRLPGILLVCLIPLLTAPAVVHAKGKKKPCVSAMADCPDAGCGGDPELNKLKNRTDKASETETWSVSDVVALDEDNPSHWTSGDDRGPLRDLGEGTAVTLEGYLIHAKTAEPEACNCRLSGDDSNDIHLNLAMHKADGQEESVVAEMSPRTRSAEWRLAALQKLAKRKAFVRVKGWLLLDTQHLSGSGGARGTLWEVHPVTDCEVCTKSVSQCEAGQGWKNLTTFH